MEIELPNGWKPRAYQHKAWTYLEGGGKHAELVWHRRSGKDDLALHRTAVAAFERVGVYWHMLPLAVQVRKAIWDAVNPHTGKRRIDEAFPVEIRSQTREDQMFIRFKNGSTWQAIGSDNYNSLVGSPPVGIVYSEWALANPAARAYLRPIFAENNGWQLYITTPRGRNHAYTTFAAAENDPSSFAQRLTADQTGVFTPEQLAIERKAYVEDFGEDQGGALFEQEYMCSFEAAILGAYYGKELNAARTEGRLTKVPYDPKYDVYTAWDIGYSDDTTIWFWQVVGNEFRIIDFYYANGHGVEHYTKVLDAKEYRYAKLGRLPFLWLPHDAEAKTFAAAGKSVQQQFLEQGYHSRIVPKLSVQDGIQAARKVFPRCWFDAAKCEDGLNALAQYQREYDDERRMFRDQPRHDWTSHASDGFRMLAVACQHERPLGATKPAKPRDRYGFDDEPLPNWKTA